MPTRVRLLDNRSPSPSHNSRSCSLSLDTLSSNSGRTQAIGEQQSSWPLPSHSFRSRQRLQPRHPNADVKVPVVTKHLFSPLFTRHCDAPRARANLDLHSQVRCMTLPSSHLLPRISVFFQDDLSTRHGQAARGHFWFMSVTNSPARWQWCFLHTLTSLHRANCDYLKLFSLSAPDIANDHYLN